MSPPAQNQNQDQDLRLNATVPNNNSIESPDSQNEDFNGISVALQDPGGHVNDSEVIPLPQDASAYRATEDVEASHQETATPAYSVFSNRQRKFIISMVACAGFFSTLSANIYFPALNALSRDLKVSNSLINLTLTSYMVFQGLAPTIFGDLADMIGRRPAYILGFIIYISTRIGNLFLSVFADRTN